MTRNGVAAQGTTHDGDDRTTHFTELDGIRGALACIVMLMHYGMDRIISVLTRGYLTSSIWVLAVDFFFVLSGFVLARSMQARQPGLGTYFRSRLFRLAPMFLFSLAVQLACGSSADLLTLAANLLMVQSIFGLQSINFPSWSIPFELYFPVLWLWPVRTWSSWSPVAVKIGFVLMLMLAAFNAYELADGQDHDMARAFHGIGLGMLLHRLAGARVSVWRGSQGLVLVLFMATLLVMVLAGRFPVAAIAFHPLASAVILAGATAKGLFSSQPLQMLGRWSYSIYLLHIPVLVIATTVLGSALVGHNPALKLVLAATTIAVAAACYRWIEHPMMRLAKSGRGGRALPKSA